MKRRMSLYDGSAEPSINGFGKPFDQRGGIASSKMFALEGSELGPSLALRSGVFLNNLSR